MVSPSPPDAGQLQGGSTLEVAISGDPSSGDLSILEFLVRVFGVTAGIPTTVQGMQTLIPSWLS